MAKISWRLYASYFDGPGKKVITVGDAKLVIDVDADGYFQIDENPHGLPLHAFAAIVGGKRTQNASFISRERLATPARRGDSRRVK